MLGRRPGRGPLDTHAIDETGHNVVLTNLVPCPERSCRDSLRSTQQLRAEWMPTMADLKTRFAAVLATPEGKALIEKGQKFSTEELQTAFAQILAEAHGSEREVINAAMNAFMARRPN
jgi:hypothetical protein